MRSIGFLDATLSNYISALSFTNVSSSNRQDSCRGKYSMGQI
jgi:hypothetical protein